MEFKNLDLDDYDRVSEEILEKFKEENIFLLIGEMGAGKTTFIKSFCSALGVKRDEVNSPTFSIVNEYLSNKNEVIYHFDCYRLEDIEEALDIGIEDYLCSENKCVIEWPEKIIDLIPDRFVKLAIENVDGQRIISVKLCQ